MIDSNSQLIQSSKPRPPLISVKGRGKAGFPTDQAPPPSFGKKLRKPSMKKPNSIDRTHVTKQAGPTTNKGGQAESSQEIGKKGSHHQIKSYDNCIDSIENQIIKRNE